MAFTEEQRQALKAKAQASPAQDVRQKTKPIICRPHRPCLGHRSAALQVTRGRSISYAPKAQSPLLEAQALDHAYDAATPIK